MNIKPNNKLKILIAYLNNYNQSHFYNYYPRGIEYNVAYLLPSPRIGINYNVNENMNLFLNLSMNGKEPGTNDLKYDLENCTNNTCLNPSWFKIY